MKKMKSYLFALLMGAAVALSFTSCSDDKLGPSIFPDESDVLDPSSSTYKFDKWLKENYLVPYNLDFRYRLQDVGTNMNYNLVPADFERSIDLALLTKYLWFDVYKDVVNENFLKTYGPRIIHLIGSPAYNPTSGTMILGLAEGGVKVTLYRVNAMNIDDIEMMNEYYFKTMHHEFAHILHQTITYPATFRTFSAGFYDGSNWQDRQTEVLNSQGFVTNYACSAVREDFAETIANFIMLSDADWEHIYEMASRGWATKSSADDPNAVYYCFYYYTNNEVNEEGLTYVAESQLVKTVDENGDTVYYVGRLTDSEGNRIKAYPVPDTDGVDGPAVIRQKIETARQWLGSEFGVNLDALREEVQKRQLTYKAKLEELRKEVENMQ